MRKLTASEQQLVEYIYPAVKQTMERYNLSENDTFDWHGELAVTLCEAVIEYDIYYHNPAFAIQGCIKYAENRLNDRVRSILESEQYRIKEIPSGLRPCKKVGRGRRL